MTSTSEYKSYFTIEQRIRQDLRILLAVNKEFKEDIIKIRIKNGIPEKGYQEGYGVIDENNESFIQDIRELRGKYNLSEAYEYDLQILIQNEKAVDIYELNFFWHLKPFQYSDPKNPYERFVAIKLYPETTLQDIIDYWPEIKERRDSMLNLKENIKLRQDKRDNLERDLHIFNSIKQKKTYKKIAEDIGKDSRFKGKNIHYQDISKVIQRLKKESKNITQGKYNNGIFRTYKLN
jgi:hypothetical protein